MVEGALRHIRILERLDYRNMVISLKSSDVLLMIQAYMNLAERIPYALHLGVTEAGLIREGSIKSAIGIGTLLYHADSAEGRVRSYLRSYAAGRDR